MAEYEFELTFQLAHGECGERYLDALAEAGCDDAIAGFGKPGVLALDFTREAWSANAAISSAIIDVKRAIPHARLVEAGPDLVGITDLAERFGVSRQHMRKLLFEGSGAPLPVHSGNPSLWHFRDITEWMLSADVQIRGAPVSPVQVDLARTTMAVNFVKDWYNIQRFAERKNVLDKNLPEEVRGYLSDDALRQIA